MMPAIVATIAIVGVGAAAFFFTKKSKAATVPNLSARTPSVFKPEPSPPAFVPEKPIPVVTKPAPASPNTFTPTDLGTPEAPKPGVKVSTSPTGSQVLERQSDGAKVTFMQPVEIVGAPKPFTQSSTSVRSTVLYKKWIQQALNLAVMPVPKLDEDGQIGPKSLAIIKQFQATQTDARPNGTGKPLDVDGIVGPATEFALEMASGTESPK